MTMSELCIVINETFSITELDLRALGEVQLTYRFLNFFFSLVMLAQRALICTVIGEN